MKPMLFALVSLTVGAAMGWVMTRSEFARNTVPVEGASPVAGKLGPLAAVVNGERFSFGNMDRFSTMSHVFVVVNNGDAPLEVSLGETTCKCTVGQMKDSVLAPGETTEVRLEWTAKTTGPMFEQSATLITNDPQHNPLNLTVHGNIDDILKLERDEIALGDLPTSEPALRRLRLFAAKQQDLQIVKHEWLLPGGVDHLQVSVEPLTTEEIASLRSGSGVAVVLSVKPGLPLGPVAQTLRLTTNIEGHAPLEVPVLGTIVSDVSLVGAGVTSSRLLVNLGTLDKGNGIQRTVYLTVKGSDRDETTLKIVDVVPKQDFEAALGEPLRDNPKVIRYPLTIKVPAGALPVALVAEESFAKIKFAVTHPQVKELTVRVRYIVKD